MPINTVIAGLLAALLFVFPAALPASQQVDFVKITELSYRNWLEAEPQSLIPEFELSCRAVADFLRRADKEYSAEDCVSGLYTASIFLASANAVVDQSFQAGVKEDREAVRNRFRQVTDEVIGGALRQSPDAGEREHVNLLYTLIITYSKDVVADYIDNVVDRQEAKNFYVQALAEDDRRIAREGEYRQIYFSLGER